jgi:uncharacterized protein YbjT (DUF2867 family)
MEQRKTVLVLGGTGHYGQHIVKNLAAKGVPVRVLTRSATRAHGILPESVELVEGEIESREAVAAAIRGVGCVVVSVSAFDRKQIRRMWAIERDAVIRVLEEAKRADIVRIVYLSVFDFRKDIAARLHLDSANIKLEVESYLKSSGFNWTVIGVPPSMEIFFAMIRGARMIVPGGGPKALPTISPADLGEIVAQTTLRDDLGGRRIRVAGPELLSFPEAARRLSTVYGKTIRFLAIPLVLPRMAWYVTRPLIRISSTLYFVNAMLGFIQLLNQFPQEIALAALQDHKDLLRTFDYAPTTLEMEARRRLG